MKMLDSAALDIIFRNARTHNGWLNQDVPDPLLREVFDLLKMAPTSANCSPARLIFVKSPEAKAKLLQAVAVPNQEKTKAAPVTAIIAHDMEFYEKLPKLFPHTDAKAWFKGNEELIKTTAFRNGTLQGAYLMIAARAKGLDCGPMSGFDNAKLDGLFFAGSSWRSNFICNLGYGDPSKLHPRSPRLEFEEACKIV